MSGEPNRPVSSSASTTPGATPTAPGPLVTPDQATILLDQVIYEQVLEAVDVDALYRLEQTLIMQISDLDGVSHLRAENVARSMIERALLRLPDDIRRCLSAAAFLECDGCELCDEEALQVRRSRDPSAQGRRRSPPPGS
jgi:hypothetical protein